jgi:hypothetical protein
MSKIRNITVSNLKAVSNLTADFNGCTAIITGGNNKGKSTFLRALPDRIRGIKPEAVLKHNETEGQAELILTTGERFVWKFNGKNDKLTFYSEKNIPQSVTRELAKVYFPAVFDVDEFLNSTPAKQKATLQKLTGIDFTEFDRVYQNAYDERTFANKRVAEEKARLVLIDPDLPAELLDLTAMEKEFNGIEAHNLRYETVVKGIKDKENSIAENDIEISNLMAKVEALQNKNTTLRTDVANGRTWIAEDKNKRKENGAELAQKIANVKETNKAIEENLKAKKQHELYEVLVKDADACEEKIKQLNAEKLDVIRNASMPEGFGFDDNGITYNGFPFDKNSLSSSAIYIAALKLAALTLGDVKTLHFDASFLDKNSLAEIEVWANENDLQLLIERPDWEGKEITYVLTSELETA